MLQSLRTIAGSLELMLNGGLLKKKKKSSGHLNNKKREISSSVIVSRQAPSTVKKMHPDGIQYACT